MLDGVELNVRANLGIYTQPISFIGLPVVVVPVPLEPLPIGVQIIGNYLEDRTTITFAGLIEREFGGFTSPPNFT